MFGKLSQIISSSYRTIYWCKTIVNNVFCQNKMVWWHLMRSSIENNVLEWLISPSFSQLEYNVNDNHFPLHNKPKNNIVELQKIFIFHMYYCGYNYDNASYPIAYFNTIWFLFSYEGSVQPKHCTRLILGHTVYPKKYAHGFVVLCFVVVMQSFIMNSHGVFIHIH